MDAAFYEATQQAMLRDLEIVNDELRTAKEQSDRANQVQADFFAVMSLELRTPLNRIITSLSLSKDTASQKEKDHLLNVADTSAEHLMSVINYLLDFSKLEAGELKLHRRRLSVKCIKLLFKCLRLNCQKRIFTNLAITLRVHGFL